MPKVLETRRVRVSDVKFSQEFYPREKPRTATVEQYADAIRAGNEFPPIELDVDGMILLDGYHRWKAYQETGAEEIDARIIALEGTPRLLYAAGRNALHGDRLSRTEKTAIARQMAELGVKQTEIQEWLKVSAGTVSSWVSDITQRQQRSKDAKVWWLDGLGWTHDEVGKSIGITDRGVAKIGEQTSNLKKVLLDQHARGRSVEQIAEAEDIPAKLAEVLLLDGKTDEQRMEYLKVGIQPYDVWTFSGCDPRFGSSYPGRVPGQILLHLMWLYTKQGDTVLDPMAGSGTTIDAAAYMGRKVYGYDAHPFDGREDIIKHNIAKDGWPERTAQASLIFWDPPYYKKVDDGYGEESVSRFGREMYLSFFERAARTIPDKFNGRLAFLCSDYNDDDNPKENIWYWDYVGLFTKHNWAVERHIQVPLSTQQVHPDIVNRFRRDKKLARLGRDLVIFRHV